MAIDIPTKEPTRIVAGDILEWKREDLTVDFPATGGWVLTYAFRARLGRFDITAAADGDKFSVSETAAVTVAYPPGLYLGAGYVTKGAERRRVYQGELTVEADLASQAEGFDTRSKARQALDAIEAVLEKVATQSQRAYTLPDGRRVERVPVGDLLILRNHYRAEVNREEAVAARRRGKGSGGLLGVRFGERF